MTGPHRLRPLTRLLLAASFAITALGGVAAAPGGSVDALSRWTGGIDLYRTGVFTTQKTWLWCTAADVQIMRNITDQATDHTRANQERYFNYMRAHNRYDIPVADGVDPAGWTAGLRHYVDDRYRLVASSSFNSALRSAVTALRRTNLPVGITVAHGGHAWVLTGFTATADPARTTNFVVLTVRVVGPLWGLQSRTYGYDMRPDKVLTTLQLKGFFTPWHYAGVKMAWEDRWVSVQPIGKAPTTAPAPSPKPSPTPSPRPTVRPTPRPTPTPTPTPTPVSIATSSRAPRPPATRAPDPSASSTAVASAAPSAEPSAVASVPPSASPGAAVALAPPPDVGASAPPAARSSNAGFFAADAPIGFLVGLVVAALAGLVAIGRSSRVRLRSMTRPVRGHR
jgi:hypothetical protein